MLDFQVTAEGRKANPTAAQIVEFQNILKQEPAVGISLEAISYHSEGVYLRELPLAAGFYYGGKLHAHRHFNLLLEGKITIWTVQGRMDLIGPCVFESMGNVRKVVYAHTPCKYMTIHANPSNERNEDALEALHIVPEEQVAMFPELDDQLLGEEKWLGDL